MASFATFSKVKKDGGGKVKFDRRSMRQQMSLVDSTKLRMVEEIREVQTLSSLVSIADSETNSLVDKVSTYPNFTIINTKLVIVCTAIMKNIRPYSDENFGKKVLEYENDIYKVFSVTEEVKKMKLLEDIVVYAQYINYMNTSMEEYEEESDYSGESEYEED
tara:strand:- start:152 stop:637 length:486 start_codon:yes stop_codon:yes gene_type:complete